VGGRAVDALERMPTEPSEIRGRSYQRDILRHQDAQDIVNSGAVCVGGCDVRSKEQTGVQVGIIKMEFPSPRLQQRVPIHVFGVGVAGHQDPADTCQFSSDQCA